MTDKTEKKHEDNEKPEFHASIVPKYLVGSEKEIEQDPILHTALHFLMHRGRELLAVAAVIILFFSLITGYSAYKESQEKKASGLVARAMSLEDETRKMAELKSVTDKYGSTHTGKQALLLLARLQEDAGQVEEARATLKKAVSGLSGLLQASAYLQSGYLNERANQPDKAKAEFEAATKEPAFAAVAQLDLARVAEQIQDKEAAKNAYRKYLELSGDSPANKGFVEWRLSRL
ncbi:MAG: tetratricopeptide repeat protein [Deltaproteobacteria bacterium]|jgi:predicted negative regulator of RcsB-dependent stress response|nr:tetratricopeptide repeat protein [Deltaproteobacteria bacterium]